MKNISAAFPLLIQKMYQFEKKTEYSQSNVLSSFSIFCRLSPRLLWVTDHMYPESDSCPMEKTSSPQEAVTRRLFCGMSKLLDKYNYYRGNTDKHSIITSETNLYCNRAQQFFTFCQFKFKDNGLIDGP